jgi:hypothetical protein
MQIKIKKLTGEDLMRRACEMTMKGQRSTISLDKIYKCEHSPIRTQIFWIEMKHIPTFVSVHLVRHKIGVEHFVESNRPDRHGAAKADRMTPVNHAMLINAQALINMAKARLCFQASPETREVMLAIKHKMFAVDPALGYRMVPTCLYRGGICPELKPCGIMQLKGEDQKNVEDE